MDNFQSIFINFPILTIFLTFVIFFYWIWAFIIIYHLVRFGVGINPKIIAMIFFIGSMLLFMITVSAFNQINLSDLAANFNILNILNIDTVIRIPNISLPQLNQ
jgi:hypothetical protein